MHIAVGEAGCRLANERKAVAIVVDALRASATLAVLFEKGIAEAWVVAEVEEAWCLKQKMPEALLVGERGSVKIAGFDFSNSPTEILQAGDLTGRKVIFTSTTGAKRLLACRCASAVLVGTTVNATAVAQVAKMLALKHSLPIVIVACGVYGYGKEWASEDIAAAWVIAEWLDLPIEEALPKPSEETVMAFMNSLHGQELVALGLGDDVRWCAQRDVIKAVPSVQRFTASAAVLCRYSPSP